MSKEPGALHRLVMPILPSLSRSMSNGDPQVMAFAIAKLTFFINVGAQDDSALWKHPLQSSKQPLFGLTGSFTAAVATWLGAGTAENASASATTASIGARYIFISLARPERANLELGTRRFSTYKRRKSILFRLRRRSFRCAVSKPRRGGIDTITTNASHQTDLSPTSHIRNTDPLILQRGGVSFVSVRPGTL